MKGAWDDYLDTEPALTRCLPMRYAKTKAPLAQPRAEGEREPMASLVMPSPLASTCYRV